MNEIVPDIELKATLHENIAESAGIWWARRFYFREWSGPVHDQILTTPEATLSPHPGLSKSPTMAWLIIGMTNARTVNLSHIANQYWGDALISSIYRRLQRFFQYVRLDGNWLTLVVVRLVNAKPPWRLCLARTWKLVCVELHERADKMIAAQFLRNLIKMIPCEIHTILTHNGIRFTNRKQDTTAFEHIFDRGCRENNIDHRLTLIAHPWTNGQIERMSRTIITVKRYYYDNHDQLATFTSACNCARRLKTLKGLTLYEYICKIWTTEPENFTVKQTHKMTGLNI